MISTLTPTDKEDFWIRVYLGSSKDLVGSAIDRAYRDFNRTQHGFVKLKTKDSPNTLKDVMRNITSQAINKNFANQEEYDGWHELSCEYLIESCLDATTYKMSYGQAQKWINMSLKYMSALGENRVPDILKNYHYYHFPVDNIMQDILKLKGIAPFKVSWSRIDSYEQYLDYQKAFRKLYSNQSALDVEFKLFNQLT